MSLHREDTVTMTPAHVRWICIGLLIVSAVALRYQLLYNDFWMDEIVSLYFARKATHPIQIVTLIHHDNNHVLNTFFMYLLGHRDHWFYYRLLSFFTGIGSLGLLFCLFRKEDPTARITALAFLAFSPLHLVLSTDARGYGPMVFFCLMSLLLYRRYVKRGTLQLLESLLFNAAVILGFFSHLTFIHWYFGLAAWAICRWIIRETGNRNMIKEMWGLHLVPILFLSGFYYIHVQHIAIGGGPVFTVTQVLKECVDEFTGVLGNDLFSLMGLITAVIVFGGAMVQAFARRSAETVFFLVSILLSPALLILTVKPELLYDRYFYVSIFSFMILLSGFLSYLSRKGMAGKALYILLITGVLMCNASGVSRLLQHGRGNYLEALRFMAHSSGSETVLVGSDCDFRNGLIVDYFAPFVRNTTGKTVRYLEMDKWPEGGIEWIISHDSAYHPAPDNSIIVEEVEYGLAKICPYGGYTGWNWYVYRKTGM